MLPPRSPTARAGPPSTSRPRHHQDTLRWQHRGLAQSRGAMVLPTDESPQGERTLEMCASDSSCRGRAERRDSVRRTPSCAPSPLGTSAAPGFEGASWPLSQARPSGSDPRVLCLLPPVLAKLQVCLGPQGERRMDRGEPQAQGAHSREGPPCPGPQGMWRLAGWGHRCQPSECHTQLLWPQGGTAPVHDVPTMGHLGNPETKALSVSLCSPDSTPLLVTLGGGVERGALFTQVVT